ncbi:uncharacterized protein LOC129600120 [Paramacrobiotus metropolitanus]|uniref:uncharacterized protein LOC129600120 n=1 Tax=Paramacrobiotus metropolitanus TaxID=2943436 RepID=UPI002445770F|nr:uncharacterized protein LOC129600120 [Paramacrobiotus metropolitanus]
MPLYCDEPYRVCSDLDYEIDSNPTPSDVLVVSITENGPYSYQSPPGSQCFCGLTVTLLKGFALDLRLRLLLIPDRSAYFNTSENGSPNDVINGRADVSVCGLSVTAPRWTEYDFVPFYLLRVYHVAVHRRHIIHSEAISILDGLANCFDRTAWIGIAMLSVVIYLTVFGINLPVSRAPNVPHNRFRLLLQIWKSAAASLWDFLTIALGGDFYQPKPEFTTYSIFLLSWIPWMMVVCSIITTSLTATLSVSIATPPFSSFNGFMESPFYLATRIIDATPDGIPYEARKTKTIVTGNAVTDDIILDRVAESGQQIAVVCYYDEAVSCVNKGFVPVFPAENQRWISVIQSKKNRSFMKAMQRKMLMLAQTGITRHLMGIHKVITYADKSAALTTYRHLIVKKRGAANVLSWQRLDRVFYVTMALYSVSSTTGPKNLCSHSTKCARIEVHVLT